ncbi:recombinase family protein [Streptomyces sp. NPDC005236]|uniref:recombinase family protein n=1 Tax=Streptomyces sp. NPDC005236 TaxID=3157028 RepID=UPI0033BE1C82
MPAYGFEVYKREDGTAQLRQNPRQADVIREIASRLLAEGGPETPAEIADDLNGRKEPTPRGARPSKRIADSGRTYKWTAAGIRKMLKSEALMGWKMESRPVSGKKYYVTVPVVDKTGSKIRMAEPIFTDEEWRTLQTRLSERSFPVSPPRHVTPFLDVVRCGYCKGKMRMHVSRRKTKSGRSEYPKFRCVSPRTAGGKTQYGCKEQVSWEPDRLLAALELHLMKQFGDVEAQERIYVVGANHGIRIREIEDLVSAIKADTEPGRRYGTALARLQAEEMLGKLDTEYKSLSEASTVDRWEYRSVGKTWRQMWKASATPELETLLRENGVRFLCYREHFELFSPERLKM